MPNIMATFLKIVKQCYILIWRNTPCPKHSSNMLLLKERGAFTPRLTKLRRCAVALLWVSLRCRKAAGWGCRDEESVEW